MIIETAILAAEIAAAAYYLGRKLDRRILVIKTVASAAHAPVSHHAADDVHVKNQHGETVYRRPAGHPDLRELKAHGGFTFHDANGKALEEA